MTNVCDICGAVLATKRNLKIHKETAKKCLRFRTISSENKTAMTISSPDHPENRIDCRLCLTNVLRTTYRRHLLNYCKNFDEKKHEYTNDGILYKNTEIDDVLIENRSLKETITQQQDIIIKFRENILEDEIRKHKLEIALLKETIIKKDEELSRYAKVLEKKAFEPKNVNNYGIIQHYLSKPIDLEGIKYKEIVNEKLELSHIKDGEVGMANFVIDQVIRDKETKEVYMVCCDEKKTLKYVKTDGVTVTDRGGKFFLQTMKKKLIPFVNKRITDLVEALPEEEKDEYLKLYGKLVVLGYAFSEHIATRTYINKDGGINPFRDQCEIKVITDAEAKMATKRMKDDRKDRRKMVDARERRRGRDSRDAIHESARQKDRRCERREETKQRSGERREETEKN